MSLFLKNNKEEKVPPWQSVVPEEMPGKMPDGKPWPKISIVTASFNQGQFLEETIRSVVCQQYPNLEYIIIDGGSTDNSVEIIKDYEQYISCWVTEPDSGHGHALNKGFARTTGDIMGWINSDDFYLPGAFRSIAEIFSSHEDIRWLTSNNALFFQDKNVLKKGKTLRGVYEYINFNYVRKEYIQQESTFWKRSLWEETGAHINEEFKFMIDSELWCRYFLREELWNADTHFSAYRVHDLARSNVFESDIQIEHEHALESLRKQCDNKRLERAKKMKFFPRKVLKKLEWYGLTRFLPIPEDIKYKRVVKLNDRWVKG